MNGLCASKKALGLALDAVPAAAEKGREQRVLSTDFLNHCNHFSPKHYPRIFLDQRLQCNIFKLRQD